MCRLCILRRFYLFCIVPAATFPPNSITISIRVIVLFIVCCHQATLSPAAAHENGIGLEDPYRVCAGVAAEAHSIPSTMLSLVSTLLLQSDEFKIYLESNRKNEENNKPIEEKI